MAVYSAFLQRSIALLSLPATIVILAWLFSPEVRDSFLSNYAIAITVAMLSRFGSDQFLYKTLSNKNSEEPLSSSYQRSTLLLSFMLALAALLGWELVAPDFFTGIKQFSFVTTVFAFILLFDRATAFQMTGNTLWSSLSYPTVFLGILLISLVTGATVNGAFFITSLTIIALCLLGIIVERRRSQAKEIALPALARKLTPYAAVAGSKTFFDWGASIYLVTLLNPAALSVFVIANRLAALLSIPASSLNAYFLREFSVNLGSGDAAASRGLMAQSIRLCLVTQITIIGLFIAAHSQIASFFKVDIGSLTMVLIPLSIAQVFHGFTATAVSMLLMSGHELRVAKISVLAGFGALIFGYLGTLWFGLSGLAIAISAVHVLQNILYVFSLWQFERILPFAGTFRLK
jgi:O-antigen/teichoic acid export membrane protein